ncbi:MAG: hypothetical protein SGJ17_10860 [Hyphomicrobiales bacterium]|nr:hypothetical protein [Hyphomicrobiales bacterium]
MTDTTHDLTAEILRKIQSDLSELKSGQLQSSKLHQQTLSAVTTLAEVQQQQSQLLKQLVDQGRNHRQRLNAIDGRLGLIEERIGVVDA